MATLSELADTLVLGSLLERLQEEHGGYDLIAHWQQGEFHHDVVLRVSEPGALRGAVLVVATNCNGGVKEVLAFDQVPDRSALWHRRCPTNAEFSGDAPEVLGSATTTHWFDPCELLRPDARSELREDFRVRQPGGGWMAKRDAGGGCGNAGSR
jgi:hypothetical protein